MNKKDPPQNSFIEKHHKNLWKVTVLEYAFQKCGFKFRNFIMKGLYHLVFPMEIYEIFQGMYLPEYLSVSIRYMQTLQEAAVYN